MPHPRLAFHTWPAAVYAIGDVHGCLDQLIDLERLIAADALGLDGEKWLVTLGDQIDRGPDAAGVIAHVMGPGPEGLRRFSLLGNHESLLLDFIQNPAANADYVEWGGLDTLRSYGIDIDFPPLRSSEAVGQRLLAELPPAHLAFMEDLALYLSLPGWLFVHAGIRPGVPLAQQSDDDLIWIRAPFLTSQLTGGLRVVHGHTPSADIVATPHRIDVDTHCYHTGKLSAVRVTPDGRTKYFSVQGKPAVGWS
jgi:serine/threonine protein phosphatase 1